MTRDEQYSNAAWTPIKPKTTRDMAEEIITQWWADNGDALVDRIELALERERERGWWDGFENAADIAKGERIEETLRSKIDHFKNRRKA